MLILCWSGLGNHFGKITTLSCMFLFLSMFTGRMLHCSKSMSHNFFSLWFRQSCCSISIAMFLKIFGELDSGDKFYSWNHFGVAPQIVPLKLDFTREEMEEGMHGKREEGSKCLWLCGDIFPSAAAGPLLPVQLELCINLYPLLSSKLDISLSFQTFEIAFNQLCFSTFYISYISTCVI